MTKQKPSTKKPSTKIPEPTDDAPVMKLAETGAGPADAPDDDAGDDEEDDLYDGPGSDPGSPEETDEEAGDGSESEPDSVEEAHVDTQPPPAPEAAKDASAEADADGASHATTTTEPRDPALGDAVRFTHPDGKDGQYHDGLLYVVALYPHSMVDLAETHDGPAVVHAKIVNGAARFRDPSEEPPPATKTTTAIETMPETSMPTPAPQTLAERLRARLDDLANGTAAPGATLATATDAHFRAIHNFLNDMQNEDMFRTWVESLAPDQGAHMEALLHDPRAHATFGNGAVPAPAADAAVAAPPADAGTTSSSHGPPPAAVDENNRRIAERFRGMAKATVTVTTGDGTTTSPAAPTTTAPPAANTPHAPPARTQPIARLPFLRQPVPVPVARQALAAAKPDLCVRGCRIDHTHHF